MRPVLSGCPFQLVLVLSSLAAMSSSVAAQPVWPLTPAAVSPLAGGALGFGDSLRAVSHDGHRVALMVRVGTEDEFRVVDARTGGILFRRVAPPVDQVALADTLLTPDGGTVVFGEVQAAQPAVRTYRAVTLATGQARVVGEGARSSYLLAASADARVVASATLLYPQLLTVHREGRAALPVVDSCPGPSSVPLFGPTLLSADGKRLVFTRAWNTSATAQQKHASSGVVDTDTGDVRCLSSAMLPDTRYSLGPVAIDGSGHLLVDPSAVPFDGPGVGHLRRVDADTREAVLPGFWKSIPIDLSNDGRFVLVLGRPVEGDSEGVYLFDRQREEVTAVLPSGAMPAQSQVSTALVSGDGSTVAFSLLTTTPLAHTVYVARLDVDGDGLPDAWERAFGLDPSMPADAVLDSDGDGWSNAQEFAAGTHPRGTPVRYFAEGAHGTFFATSLALFNPADAALTANVRFLGPDGATASYPVPLQARAPAYVDLDHVALPFTEFAIVVESPSPILAERRMTWDRARQYGSHAGTGVAEPSPTWHFAEGATIAGLQSFFLLQNPGDVPATVTLRYLLSTATSEERVHVVPGRSRLTVWVNQEGAPLHAAEFATTIMADQPIVAERAMYRDAPGEAFGAGSVTAGVASPAAVWGFAEGATGAFFDTYLLLANPGDAWVDADVQYIPPAPAGLHFYGITVDVISRRYRIPPRSRRTIRVAQEDPRLADTPVSMTVGASAPIVAERTMWWPGSSPATWRENHTEGTIESAGLRWAVADVQVDAGSDGWDTFLLIDTPPPLGPLVHLRASCDDGTTASHAMLLSPYRTTIWLRHEMPAIVGKRCGMIVESEPRRLTLSPLVAPVQPPIHVEKTMYRGGFAAGSASMATRLPDPR